MNLFRLFLSPSLSPHQKSPKSNLPITSFQIYVVSLSLLLKIPDSSEGQPFLLSVFFFCVYCVAQRADLRAVKCDIATSAECLCEVGVGLRGKGEQSSSRAPALMKD